MGELAGSMLLIFAFGILPVAVFYLAVRGAGLQRLLAWMRRLCAGLFALGLCVLGGVTAWNMHTAFYPDGWIFPLPILVLFIWFLPCAVIYELRLARSVPLPGAFYACATMILLGCAAYHFNFWPFPLGGIWGVATGWEVDPRYYTPILRGGMFWPWFQPCGRDIGRTPRAGEAAGRCCGSGLIAAAGAFRYDFYGRTGPRSATLSPPLGRSDDSSCPCDC